MFEKEYARYIGEKDTKCRFVRYEAIENLREQWIQRDAQGNSVICEATARNVVES